MPAGRDFIFVISIIIAQAGHPIRPLYMPGNDCSNESGQAVL
jgi:hypothetical protein